MSSRGRKSILTVYGSNVGNGLQWYVDLRSEMAFSELHDITVIHASELSRRKSLLEHDITELNYDVIYFCANHDYDETTVGNALASYVSKGGILVLTGPCTFNHLLTLKGNMEPLIPIRRAPQIHSQRTVDQVNTEEYAPIFKTLKSAVIHSMHIQVASMTREDSRCFRIATDTNRGILAAVNLHGKGMIIHLNVCATSFQRNQGHAGGGLFGAPYPAFCANSKKLVLNAIEFALTTDVLKPKSGLKRKHCLISSDTDHIRFIRIKLADSMYVGTDAETAMKCGEVISAMVEGDRQADEYYVKIPCTKCAQSLAYFLKTASLPASCIRPESFLSLLQAADYLQSDRLMDAIREYFMLVKNAEKVSKCDVDFNHEKLPFATLKSIMPPFQSFLNVHGSPWKRVFMRWGKVK